jgi:hypothetical protein
MITLASSISEAPSLLTMPVIIYDRHMFIVQATDLASDIPLLKLIYILSQSS